MPTHAQLSCDWSTPAAARSAALRHQQCRPAAWAAARPCPGYPGLTPSSLFSHALFGCFMEEAVRFDFPRKKLHFHSPPHARAHTAKRDGVNLFILLADSCFSCFLFLSAVHPSTDPQKPDGATKNPLLFSKLHLNNSSPPPHHQLLCTFHGSLHLLQCRPQRPSSQHRCAHRSASIRAYYLIFPTIQKLKSIFLP